VLFCWAKTSPFFQQRKWVSIGIFCFSSGNLIHFVIKFLKIEIGWHDPSYGLGQ